MQVHLTDFYKLHNENPRENDFPNMNALKNIKIGDYIKVCNGKEKFWTNVMHVEICEKDLMDSKIIAVVNERLFETDDYDIDAMISYQFYNIYGIGSNIDLFIKN